MISEELEFIRALHAFGQGATYERKRNLQVARHKVLPVADECSWPPLIRSAIELVEAISFYPVENPHMLNLAQLASDNSVALAAHFEKFTPPAAPENPVEHVRPAPAMQAPATPAAPIRQYKDD